MKIALLSEKYTPDIGGLAISTGRLAHLLSSAGHQVFVSAPTSSLPPSEKQTLTHEAVNVTRFGARKRVDDSLVDWFDLLVEEYKRKPFDVLHAYFLPQAGFVAAYAGKYLDVPSVVSIRGNDIEQAAFDPSRFSHVMYALQNANAVTGNTNELVKKAQAFIDREVTLIPNGIDVELFKPVVRNEVLFDALQLDHAAGGVPAAKDGSSSSVHVIGFVGELREKKGLKTLLSGYAQVNHDRPTTLLIVGDIREGEDRQALESFRLANPACRIIISGYVSHTDLPAYYSLIDIFVHPSLRDGMPNALLEAMACERPVIVTPVGGMLDIVEDGKNGLLFNVNDANALAKAICELIASPEKRMELGRSARRTITDKFSPRKELEANLNVYRKIGLAA